MDINFFLYVLFAFILGSFPTGYILSKKIALLDIREEGSRNIGATNVLRTIGWKIALPVFIIDVAKGSLSVFIPSYFGDFGSFPIFCIGLSSILGHCYSPFLKFKGGKGVATTLGVMIYLFTFVCFLSVLSFVICYLISRYVSLSSIIALLLSPIFYLVETKYFYWSDFKWNNFLGFFVLIFIILISHRENIKRLIGKNELKI